MFKGFFVYNKKKIFILSMILGGITEEAEKEYEESIYKSLIEIGEDEEYARKVAKGEEEPDGILYFPEYCFEFTEGGTNNGK